MLRSSQRGFLTEGGGRQVVSCALTAAALGLGSPLGYLLLRYVWTHHQLLGVWWAQEMLVNGWFYLYAGLGTVIMFGLLGFCAGRRQDRLERDSRQLEKTTQTLRHLSMTDGVTGLYVHRYLLERLEQEARRSLRYKAPLACLFIDVDQFKSINDQHGHLFGDEVLRQISRSMRGRLRDTDILGRYGGDEFLAILPETDADQAFEVGERIRRGVEALELTSGRSPVKATVSVGVIAARAEETSVSDYLKWSDEALRRSKHLGRNRTLLCEAGRFVSAPPSQRMKMVR